MVAPLLAAGARVAAKSTVRKAGVSRGISSAATGTRSYRHLRSVGNYHAAQKQNGAEDLVAKVTASRITWMLIMFLTPFYIGQFFFALAMLTGMGLEIVSEEVLAGIFNFISPGEKIFSVAWALTWFFVFSIYFMTIFAYTFAGIRWTGLIPFVLFLITLALSFVPVFNLFPLILLFMFSVIASQKAT